MINQDIGLALAYQRGENISYDEFDRGAKALESVNTNWFDVLYQTPFSHSHSLSFSGGNENSTYYASLGIQITKIRQREIHRLLIPAG